MEADADTKKEAMTHALEKLSERKPYLIPTLCERFKDRMKPGRQVN